MPSSSLPAATIRTQVLVPLRFGDGYTTTARAFSFDGLIDGQENLAFGLGDRAAPLTSSGSERVPLVRPHSECLTGDVFGSQRCDCGQQLREAVERIADHGGYLLYLRQEGRGIGLYAKLEAYRLQDAGLDTYEANIALGHREDERSYLAAAQMLMALGVAEIALLPGTDRGTPLGGKRSLSGHEGGPGRAHTRPPAIGRVRFARTAIGEAGPEGRRGPR